MVKRRAGTVIAACTLGLLLAGCGSMSDFSIDPSEWVPDDWFNTKKKLQGERKPVFPDGVPGVSKGIPPEMVKGYQPDADQEDALAQKTADKDQSKDKPKAKPKPKVAAKPPTAETPSRPTSITVRRSDAPAAQQQQSSAEPWPDPTPPGQQSGAASPWPDPPRPGTGGGVVQWPDPPPTR